MLRHLMFVSAEGALLAGCVWLVCRALPRMSPRVRALLWWCVAAKFVVALVWPAPIRVPVLPRPVSPEASGAPAPINGSYVPRVQGSFVPRPEPAPLLPEVPAAAILVGMWALGVGGALLRTAQGWRRTQAVVSRSWLADEETQGMARELSDRLASRAVPVRVSAEVESPVAVGVRRPVILVPAHRFAALSADQRQMALCHEVAHLKRGDLWLGCVPAAAERCFFFHPLARLAAREYAFWREAACDEAVLTTLGASPQSYGRMLLALGVSRQTAAFSAAGAAWSFQTLKRRITMLDRTSPLSRHGRVLAAGAVAAALLAIAPLRAVARSAEPAAAPYPTMVTYAESARPASTLAQAATPQAPVTEAAAVRAAVKADAQDDDLQFVLFHANGTTSISGRSGDAERAERYRRSGEPLLWFRRDGREYIVRDPALIRQAEELWEPVSRVGEEQGRIGEQMGEIGEEQGRIGAQMGEVGERQGRLGERMAEIGGRRAMLATRQLRDLTDSERRAIERETAQLDEQSRQLEREMEALNEEMRRFEGPMHAPDGEMARLGEEMEALGGRMEAALERANTGMRTLMSRALESGAAESVR